MATLSEVRGWYGYRVLDEVGAKAGRVLGASGGRDYDEPVWLLIGLGDGRPDSVRTVVPAVDAVVAGRHVWLPYRLEQMRAAIELAPGGVSAGGAEERALLRHYGLEAAPALIS